MASVESAEDTMALLCAVIDSWDLEEATALHRLPLTLIDQGGTILLHTAEDLRAMYQGVRARYTALGGMRMESTFEVQDPRVPGIFFAETVSTIFDEHDEVLTEFCVSHVLAQIGEAVQITTQIIEPDKTTVSPAVVCTCTTQTPPPLAA